MKRGKTPGGQMYFRVFKAGAAVFSRWVVAQLIALLERAERNQLRNDSPGNIRDAERNRPSLP